MKILFALFALFLASAATALAEAAVQYGQIYECHRDGGKFRVVSCNDATCDVFYINAYSPGGGFTNTMSRYSLHAMVDGDPAQCSIGGAAANVQAPAAPNNALAAPPANPVPAAAKPAPKAAAEPFAPQHYPGMYADMPKYKVPKAGGGITIARYECYTYSGGRLYSALAENFRLLDGRRYTDASGKAGTYTYDAGTGKILFSGAALNGIRATYHAGTPPIKKHPATVVFPLRDGNSGDTCDARAG